MLKSHSSYIDVAELEFERSLLAAKATPFSPLTPCQEGRWGDTWVLSALGGSRKGSSSWVEP